MILIIEDHLDTCESIRLNLVHAGFPASCVHNADAALAAMMRFIPELIILDDYLPEMNGLKFLEYLHGDPPLKDIPIVVYTAGTDSARQRRGTELGVALWLEKGPVDVRELVRQCARLLDGPRAAVAES